MEKDKDRSVQDAKNKLLDIVRYCQSSLIAWIKQKAEWAVLRGKALGAAGRLPPPPADYSTVMTTLQYRVRTVSVPTTPSESYVVWVPGFWLSASYTVAVHVLSAR